MLVTAVRPPDTIRRLRCTNALKMRYKTACLSPRISCSALERTSYSSLGIPFPGNRWSFQQKEDDHGADNSTNNQYCQRRIISIEWIGPPRRPFLRFGRLWYLFGSRLFAWKRWQEGGRWVSRMVYLTGTKIIFADLPTMVTMGWGRKPKLLEGLL